MTRPTPFSRWFGMLLTAFVLLCAVYAWATPPFEASDELWHMGMVDYIATNGTLPVQNPDVPTRYEQEGSQPPLYYAIGALLVRPIDRTDYDMLTQPNPHARVGIPGSVGNKNIVLHTHLNPPPQGTALSVYVLRAFSILLGAVTVTAVYLIGRQLSGERFALLAAGITAFNPMFLFITASVNNDNLVTALNSLVIWQLVVMLWHGLDWRRSLFIAVVIALASLSKLSGNVLVPIVAGAAALVAYRDGSWRGFVTLGVLMAGIWAGAAGWWYWRNIQLYSELFGTSMMVQVAGPRLEPFTVGTLLREFEGFRIAYWGLFGGVNVLTFAPFYWVMDIITVLAAVGLMFALAGVVPPLWRTLQRYRRLFGVAEALHLYWAAVVVMFLTIFLVASISLIAWTAQTYASQGRLLFPFVGALSPLLASGLLYWWRRAHKPYVVGGAVGGLALFALIVPFASIRPAYTPPPTVTELPASATPVYARYGAVELVGYETPLRRYQPGDDVPVTVYWRPLEQGDRDLSAFLTAVNPAGEAVGKVDTYPGGGTLRTSNWDPGQIYADSYAIPLSEDAHGQFDLRLQVGWWHYPTEDVIPPMDETDAPLESVLLDAGGLNAGVPLLDGTRPDTRVVFGQRIQLDRFTITDDNTMTMQWRARQRINGDYTVFVQVVDEAGNIVGQGDARPPLGTAYWQRGDIIRASYTITYPAPIQPGTYTVLVGWYNPQDFTRLNLPDDEDNAYPLSAVNLPGYTPTEAAEE